MRWMRHADSSLTPKKLQQETVAFRGTGGISAENNGHGFIPAFFDTAKGEIHLARFVDGRLAPMHILEGLPKDLITLEDATGRVTATVPTLIAGFVHQQRFYTREQAAALMVESDGLFESPAFSK
jgi:hypothetical protein